MKYPLDELLDKSSIIQLKFERIGNLKDKGRWINEIREYAIAIGEYIGEGLCSYAQVGGWFKELYKANAVTWDLEADIRKGQEDKLGLREVGRRAIAIRENNGIRIGIKNKIVEEVGRGYKEIKINHASSKTMQKKGYKSNP